MTKQTAADERHGLESFYDALRRPGIARASAGRWFGGVASGLARWLGVDPLVVRAAFIFFALFFGMGFSIYLVLLMLMPDERGNIFLERALKHGEGWPITLLVFTVISTLSGGPWWGGDVNGLRIGGYVVLGALVWWFLTRTTSGRALMASKPWVMSGDGTTAGASQAPWSPPVSTGNAAAAAGATMTEPAEPAEPFVQAPPRPRTPVIGFAGGLLALGLAVVAGALGVAAATAFGWTGNHIAIGIAAGLGVLGLTLVVAGLAGRRAGWLHPFVWLGIWAVVFTSAVPAGLTQPWTVGERHINVTSLTGANDYQLGLGDMSLNLTNLTQADWKATPGPDHVKASVGMGQLTIALPVLPADTKVTVNAKGRAGDLVATGTNEGSGSVLSNGAVTGATDYKRDGVNWAETVTYGSGTNEIVVDAEVGLGEIKVTTGGN